MSGDRGWVPAAVVSKASRKEAHVVSRGSPAAKIPAVGDHVSASWAARRSGVEILQSLPHASARSAAGSGTRSGGRGATFTASPYAQLEPQYQPIAGIIKSWTGEGGAARGSGAGAARGGGKPRRAIHRARGAAPGICACERSCSEGALRGRRARGEEDERGLNGYVGNLSGFFSQKRPRDIRE